MPRSKADSNNPVYISADLLDQLHGDFKDADATKFVLIRIYAYHTLRRRWPPSDVQKTARMLGLDAKHIQRHVNKLVSKGYLKVVDGVLNGCWQGVNEVSIAKKPSKSRASAVTINHTTTNQTTYSADFDSFWSSYERKGDKKKAYAEWRRMSAADRIAAVEALTDYFNFAPEFKFRKDAERYLRDQVWLREDVRNAKRKPRIVF